MPFIATLFPFIRSFRYYRSSCCSSFSFRRRVFSEFDFSSVKVSRAIYCFAGDRRVHAFRTIASSSSFAFRILVPIGGELARSVVSRVDISRVGVVGSQERLGVELGISRVERVVIGLNSNTPVFRKLERILRGRKASSRAVIYAIVHSTFEIRPGSRRESRSVSRER